MDRHRKCFGVVYTQTTGELGNCKMKNSSSSSSEHTCSALMFICTPKGCCNVDEHNLFYNVLSKKTYTFEGDCCRGLRVNKERIALLLCCNMDSCEKCPLCL
jgi:hypothetical protein